ncbi:MAG: FtsX-like permease family protein, partial [Anaerolinea sp.]|nr:FtsX-like permease family protein [Anaerolinea sp.]
MTRLVFYLRYAARNLRRNTRWTAFAVFSIAAGVATVVALRSLGLAIGDSLVDNARASNHGDLTVSYAPPANAAFAFFGRGGEEMQTFSPGEVEAYSAWAAEQNAQIAFYSRAFGLQVTPVDAVTVGRPQLVSALLIDPVTFPPTGDISATEPAGVPLSDLFPTTTSIVISQNLAEQQGVGVGDTVRVSNTTQEYTVTGIVPTETEAGTRDFFAAFFGFAYLHISQAETLQLDSAPNVASMVFPAGSDPEAMENAFIDAMRAARQPLFNIDLINVSEIMAQNETIGDYIGRFIVVMGLGALLIGGVGIINTMLVMVGRRTNEIAALKTFGLKGRQVSSLFFAEAFLLGLMGSVVGSLIGVLLSGAVNRYGEAFLQQRLVWRFYPEAIIYGLGLGMVVTLVFGILPILTANRIRPAIILRPNETHVAGVGVLHALIALLVVVIVIGLVAGQILGVPLIGVIGVALTLLILGVLVGLLWVIVWLVGKLPSFGSVDLRLALRNLSSRRIRTATTLLALSAGMFALSSITFVGVGTREILQFQLTQQFGGNVLVFPLVNLISSSIGQTVVQNIADQYPGTYNTRLAQFTVEIVSIDGQPVEVAIPFNEDAPRGMQRAFRSMPVQMRSSD